MGGGGPFYGDCKVPLPPLIYYMQSGNICVCVCVENTLHPCLPAGGAHLDTFKRSTAIQRRRRRRQRREKKNPFSGPVNTMWVNARAVGGDHDRLRLREKCQLFAAAAVTNERTKEEEEEERWEARNHVSKYVHTHAIPKRKKEKKKEKTQKSSD